MITWSQEFETGVASVDSDHRRLAEGLNDLEKALSSGSGSKQITSLLEFLERYASEHFAREESCMSRLQCPTAAANKAAHQEFIAKFETARVRLKNSSGSAALVAVQVHRELCDWIVNHILRIDSALKTCHSKPATGLAQRR
jgi:hemerythrin